MISIIIPVYNVISYLDKCLQSIHEQTYTEWECILVDDGSQDGSSELCDQWSGKDPRFKVIHQQNQGVSATRNNGIKASQGDYFVFIDSDDWVTRDYLSDLISNDSSDIELIVSGIQAICKGQIIETYIPLKARQFQIISSESEAFFDLFEKFLLFGPWAKLYKSYIIKENNILYDTSCAFGEDLLFNFEYLQYVKKIATVAKSNYFYRKDEENTLSRKFRKDQFSNDYRLWNVRVNYLKQKILWTPDARSLMYKTLWGQVYDGIFTHALNAPISYAEIKDVLSISEIEKLKDFQELFEASKWIKWLIVKRQAFLIYVYLKFLCK